MAKTTLTYTFTGTLDVTFDEDAPPEAQFTTQLTESLEMRQLGIPEGSLATFWVQFMAEQELKYPGQPLAHYMAMRSFRNPDALESPPSAAI